MEDDDEMEYAEIGSYDVYSICEGAIDEEESYDTIDEAREAFTKLVDKITAEHLTDVEVTVHLYDTFYNNLLAEETITKYSEDI